MKKLAFAALFACAVTLPASAARKRAKPVQKVSQKTIGLGRSCKRNSDCKSRSQTCIHDEDANGKPTAQGFCVLPCLSFEAGTTKVVEGAPLDPGSAGLELDKKAPPRCPAKFLCRSAGSGVPIDMCVKE